jgi:hypothetical protein
MSPITKKPDPKQGRFYNTAKRSLKGPKNKKRPKEGR